MDVPGARGPACASRRLTPKLHLLETSTAPAALFTPSGAPGTAPRRRPHWRPVTAFCGAVGAGITRPCGRPQWPPTWCFWCPSRPSGLQVAQDCLASGHASALLGGRRSRSGLSKQFPGSLNLPSASFCTSFSGSPCIPAQVRSREASPWAGIRELQAVPSALQSGNYSGACPRVLKLSRLKCFQ